MNGLIVPKIRKNCSHSFYAVPFVIDKDKVKIDRTKLIRKLKQQKIILFAPGYLNIHKFPIFQKKIAFGKNNFPWSVSKKIIDYKKNISPVAEKLHNETLFAFGICSYHFTIKNLDFITTKFIKIWKELDR